MEFTKRHDFKIEKNIEGNWVIFYRRNCWLCPFIHTVKGIVTGGEIGTAFFGSELDARYFLKQVTKRFNTITDYNRWVKSEYISRTLSSK